MVSEVATAFAAKLSGRSYGEEMTREEEAEAKALNLVVMFGASDDLLEFRGALRDEAGAYEGADVALWWNGPRLEIMEQREDADELIAAGWSPPQPSYAVRADWSPDDLGCSWRITPNVPFASFDIMEDGQLFCRGAVIHALSASAQAAENTEERGK